MEIFLTSIFWVLYACIASAGVMSSFMLVVLVSVCIKQKVGMLDAMAYILGDD